MPFFEEKEFDPDTMHPELPKATEPRRNFVYRLVTQRAVYEVLQIIILRDIRKKTMAEILTIMEKELNDETGYVHTTKALSRNLNLLSKPLPEMNAESKVIPLIECDRNGPLLRFGPATAAGHIFYRQGQSEGFFP